jgi:hypothetical protein
MRALPPVASFATVSDVERSYATDMFGSMVACGFKMHDVRDGTGDEPAVRRDQAPAASEPAVSPSGPMSEEPAYAEMSQASAWFSPTIDENAATRAGLRLTGGGGHQSKTMMLTELGLFLEAAKSYGPETARRWVFEENLLAKTSDAARQSALANLNKLYGLNRPPPITEALASIWGADAPGRPLLALLCALARDPLLRDTFEPVRTAQLGQALRWPVLADAVSRKHPDRFSPAMLKTLSQNCASTWTQSGHLAGKLSKTRRRANPTPESAAFAVLLARLAGFGGPALVDSPWLQVLDVPREERMSLLRRAQGRGLVRMREAGAVLEIEPAGELALGDA